MRLLLALATDTESVAELRKSGVTDKLLRIIRFEQQWESLAQIRRNSALALCHLLDERELDAITGGWVGTSKYT